MTAIVLSILSVLRLAIIFGFVIALAWISRHYRGNKWGNRWDWAGRRNRTDESGGLTEQEQTALNDLVRIAERMEQRLVTLEKIIEVDDPNWKERV